MITRKDYISGQSSHADYYSQFVTNDLKQKLAEFFTIEKIKSAYAKDNHFNNIPLFTWDSLAWFYISTDYSIKTKLTECGDYLTQAGEVCILKECARQLAV